jgi:hypothetical protein
MSLEMILCAEFNKHTAVSWQCCHGEIESNEVDWFLEWGKWVVFVGLM